MGENIYEQIAKRTGGDIYIGVVGPVRTGKSTFIKKFLETAVLPHITDESVRARAVDEMPQSAGGRTVMTTEPKFVPEDAVKITVGGTTLSVKAVDCVGYMADGALGGEEEGVARMVMTPWSQAPVPFADAAAIGTEKVIRDHATVAVLVTTDGTVTDLSRDSYIAAEERAVGEIKATGKPFVIVLNSASPAAPGAKALAADLEEKYGAPVALVSVADLDEGDAEGILSLTLDAFPVTSLSFDCPAWCRVLPEGHATKRELLDHIRAFSEKVRKLGDIPKALGEVAGIERVSASAADGSAVFSLPLAPAAFFTAASDTLGEEVRDEGDILSSLMTLSQIRKHYEKIADALNAATETGYGIVMPTEEEMRLDEPKTVKVGGAYGVKLSAHADSLHIIKAGLTAELSPVIGTEEASEGAVQHLEDIIRENPNEVWKTDFFGKSLYDLAKEGMGAKLGAFPTDAREKLSDTLERIVNEGAKGLVCVLL